MPSVSEPGSEASAKVGIALSGGGFRAAFFHLGVLARLAELGILRKAAVISTVSGGSIVGCLYYVLLNRRLAEGGALGDEDYRQIVHDSEARLLAAVGKNIRARTLANLWKNFVMGVHPRYSRSDRIGDLYDRYLYKPAWGEHGRERRWWGAQKQLELRELWMPEGPTLLVNATTLNSGHNWRFQTDRMGEPLPSEPELRAVMLDVDKNVRLKEGYFEPGLTPVIPDEQKDFPLGLAVAASACVPGVFHPLSISGMYEGGIRVQLVDGGVQDNQGVQGLFDHGCTHLVVSDASRQLDDDERPSTRIPGVARRSLAIANDRIRDEQLVHASARDGTAACAVMHLRKGLSGKAVAPGRSLEQAEEERHSLFSCEAFGVSRKVQERLAQVRTDLDAFSEFEAFSLALDGYLMTGYELQHHERFVEVAQQVDTPGDQPSWRFTRVESLLREPSGSYSRHLKAAKRRFFRPFFLVPSWEAIVLLLAALVLLGGAAFGVIQLGGDAVVDVLEDDWQAWAVLAAIAGAGAVMGLYVMKLPRPLSWPVDFVVGSVIPALLAIPAFAWSWLQLLAQPLTLRLGRAPAGGGRD